MIFSWRTLRRLKLGGGRQRETALSQVREPAASLHWSSVTPQDVRFRHPAELSMSCGVVGHGQSAGAYLAAGVSSPAANASESDRSPATSLVDNGKMMVSPMEYRVDDNSGIWNCAFCNIECSIDGTKPSFAGSLRLRLLREGEYCHDFLDASLLSAHMLYCYDL